MGGQIGRQFKAANERGCRVVVVQGPDEISAGEVAIKEMTSGMQQTVPLSDAPAVIKGLAASLSGA